MECKHSNITPMPCINPKDLPKDIMQKAIECNADVTGDFDVFYFVLDADLCDETDWELSRKYRNIVIQKSNK